MYIIKDTDFWASRIEPRAVSRPRGRLMPWLHNLLALRLKGRAASHVVIDTSHPGVAADFLRASGNE